ncbi:tyrosine-type recombinase/integrase [Ascidiimonas aurantiaca]|uniref:tyrosine-type recombinase/integrase n=1 Tax=Ascidiimonas aurantiaca TaxID=1685432 RepID=UPI0030EDEBEC
MSPELFLKYLSLEKNYSRHTCTAYGKDLFEFRDFCTETFGEDCLETIHYSQIRSWIIHLVDSGVSNRTINRKIASLKSYYKFLRVNKVIEVNPLARHKALKVSEKQEVPFSPDDMRRVFDLFQDEDDFETVRDMLIIELLYATGMRRAELIGLQLENVDLNAGMLKVLGKRNKERMIPLLPELSSKIHRYLVHRDCVITKYSGNYLLLLKNGNKIYETFVYRVINNYFSKASSKVKKSPHVLRHTFATHLLSQGADLNSVKELLGHSSLASTQVYTHNSISELKKVHSRSHPRNKK